MLKRLAILALFVSTLLIALAYGAAFLPGGAPAWAAWALAVGLAGSMVAMMVLGAARDGRIGKLAIPFGFVFAVLVVGFGAALAHPGTDPADPALWFGLPPRAAIILFGIGLLPLLAMPLAYALTFEHQTLRPADLERIRAHRTAARSGERAETLVRTAEEPATVEAGR